jgi:hypothetical protein
MVYLKGRTRVRPFLFLLAATAAFAADSLHAVSPNGKIDVELSVEQQERTDSFVRLTYRLTYEGKPLLDTSYMGLWIRAQEPILGENLGFTASKPLNGPGYSGFLGEYIQNGSLGKEIRVEFRAYDDGVAFRYLIPRGTSLDNFLIESDESQFHFAQATPLASIAPPPVVIEQKGLAWVRIEEVGVEGQPKIAFEKRGPNLLGIKFILRPDDVGLDRPAPFTGPWRVITIAPTQEQLHPSLAERLR